MRAFLVIPATLLTLSLAAAAAAAQSSPPLPGTSSPSDVYDPLATPAAPAASSAGSLLTQPNMTPGQLALLNLDRKFADAVAKGGGKVFASWMTDDSVSLPNKQPAKLGKAAILASATWDSSVYQLTWTPTGAEMGPSNDMGFTWGHYEGHSRDAHGQSVMVSGRYITVWKRLPDGQWKVALDASAEEPPSAGDCCASPKP